MINATIAGNLGKDAVVRDARGTPVCSFGVASTSKVKGEKVTTWVDCSIWGKRGESLAEYLTKGSRVCVVGELSTREYDGKTYLQCKVDQIELLGSKRDGVSVSASHGASNAGYDEPDKNGAMGDDDVPF